MDNTFFWFWLVMTAAICSYPLLRAWRDPRRSLEFPVVASLMWIYLYVSMPWTFVSNSPTQIDSGTLTLGTFLPFGCFAALLWGWSGGTRRNVAAPRVVVEYNPESLWIWGLSWLTIGVIGQFTFSYSGRGFGESSAYWYMLFNLAYPGMSLCVAAWAMAPKKAGALSIGAFLLLAGAMILPRIADARRGPTFVAIMALAFAYMLTRKKLPPMRWIVGVVGVAGFVVLLFIPVRTYIYMGKSWGEALTSITFADIFERRAKQTADNEFVNHCSQIEANIVTGEYQYGTAHLLMLAHWVPRQWWPNKPVRNQGLYPEARSDPRAIAKRTFHSNISTGGAWGTVADTFNQYWYFCFIFWYLIGRLAGGLYSKAMSSGDMRWKMHYLALLMSTHWFIAQCMPEALVPFLFFQAAFWITFKFSAHKKVPALGGMPRWPTLSASHV